MTLLELRILKDSLSALVYKHPELSNFATLHANVKALVKADPRYQKGKQLLKIAEDNGISDGYAGAEDYYFAIKKHERYTSLLLCFKFDWWMNGETYSPKEDNQPCRNFDDFLPVELETDDFDSENIQQDPEVVRKWLLDAGMEEKPELVALDDAFNKAYLEAEERQTAERREKWEAKQKKKK